MPGKRSFQTLDDALLRCAGEPAQRLDALAAAWPADAALLRRLIRFAEGADPAAQQAAVKFLGLSLEKSSAPLPPDATRRLLDLLPTLAHWEARLHALQVLPRLSVPATHADALRQFLEHCRTGENKFLRAWAYGGLHHLAAQHGGYRAEIALLLARAVREEAPSIRARLRRLPPLPPSPA